ncbi:hypothetical protein ACTFIR_007308 [Dictyostelium discoideum]
MTENIKFSPIIVPCNICDQKVSLSDLKNHILDDCVPNFLNMYGLKHQLPNQKEYKSLLDENEKLKFEIKRCTSSSNSTISSRLSNEYAPVYNENNDIGVVKKEPEFEESETKFDDEFIDADLNSDASTCFLAQIFIEKGDGDKTNKVIHCSKPVRGGLRIDIIEHSN